MSKADAEKIWLKRIRIFVGVLGTILPWIALLGTFIFDRANPGSFSQAFWDKFSISATYYLTPPLVGILTTAAITLMCYKGYELKDHVVTTITGVFGIMIVIFPCNCPYVTDETLVGFFQLPAKVSHVVHCVSAVAFFVLLAYNSMFLFTKTYAKDGKEASKEISPQKQKRNIIYRVCAFGMIGGLALLVIPFKFTAKTFICEAIALTFFGVSWLVKGEIFGFLADKDEES